MALKNSMEEIVRNKLDSLLSNYDICKCDQCYMDMLAIALNEVKSAYTNTLEGDLLKKIDATRLGKDVEIDVVVIKAIEKVKEHPHHN